MKDWYRIESDFCKMLLMNRVTIWMRHTVSENYQEMERNLSQNLATSLTHCKIHINVSLQEMAGTRSVPFIVFLGAAAVTECPGGFRRPMR